MELNEQKSYEGRRLVNGISVETNYFAEYSATLRIKWDIYDRVNEATVEGGFETQKWAESIAEVMEVKYGKDKSDSKADGRAVRARHKHKQHAEVRKKE